MASGQTLASLSSLGSEPPASSYATPDTRNSHPVLDFDASAIEAAMWSATLPRAYSGGGLTITIMWAASTATSGAVVWTAAFERIDASGLDTDADSFASAKSVTANAPGTSGQVVYSTIAFSNSEIDGLLAGEFFRLKITRDATNGSDTMSGDAEIFGIEIKET